MCGWLGAVVGLVWVDGWGEGAYDEGEEGEEEEGGRVEVEGEHGC